MTARAAIWACPSCGATNSPDAAYISLAMRRVGDLTRPLRVLLAVLLVTTTLLALYAHRFAVFAATLWVN